MHFTSSFLTIALLLVSSIKSTPISSSVREVSHLNATPFYKRAITASKHIPPFRTDPPKTIQEKKRVVKQPVAAQQMNSFLSECLEKHNAVRKSNNLRLLVLDNALIKSAQSSADFIASRPNLPLQHNAQELHSLGYGENLARGFPTCATAIVNC